MSTVRSWLISQGLISPHDLPSPSGEFRLECPECQHHAQKLYVNALGKGASCKHCGYEVSWRKFQRRYEPPTPQEIALESFVSNCQKALGPYRGYLRDRGFEDTTIDQLRFGYADISSLPVPDGVDHEIGLAVDGQWYFAERLIIPYLVDGLTVKVRARANPDDPYQKIKYLDRPGAEALPYHPAPIDPSKPVIITEGEFDAAILFQNGYQSIGIPGANNFKKSWVREYPDLYLAFDSDETGRKAAAKVFSTIEEIRNIELPDKMDGKMDVSDYLATFGVASFANLVERATLYVYGKAQRDDRLKTTVEDWSEWAFTNGELLGPRIKWAPRLERALSGWSRGVFLLGALPNSGKSCLLVQSAYECAKDNPDDTISVYLSLDDDIEDAITRLVSNVTLIDFEKIRSPRYYLDNPTDSTKRDPQAFAEWSEALDYLKGFDNLIIRDAKFGRSLGYLQNYFRSLRNRYPDKHIVLFIDSLAKIIPGDGDDVKADSSNKGAWKAFLATELKYQSTLHNLCIVTPCDFRKINDNRRPTNDDLKDAAELAYEANCILLGFNEVNVNGDQRESILTWEYEGTQYPLFEINVSKNKKTKFRGTIRLKFYPQTCSFKEQTIDEDGIIDELIRMKAEENKKVRV